MNLVHEHNLSSFDKGFRYLNCVTPDSFTVSASKIVSSEIYLIDIGLILGVVSALYLS